MIIADKILYLRKRLGLTQEELAEQLNVSRQSISKWESAQSIPDVSKIMAMAELFSISTDYLLRDEIETIEGEITQSPRLDKNEMVTIEKANLFISNYIKHVHIIALGVLLCIFSVIPLITLLAFTENFSSENIPLAIGMTMMFALVAAAIGMFIYSGSIVRRFQHIIDGEFELSNNVEGIIREYKELYMPIRTKTLIISIISIVLSALPIIVTSLLTDNGNLMLIMVSILLACVSVAVFNIIRCEGNKDCYEMLLFEGDFRKNRRKENEKIERIETFFWLIVTAVYLGWSFITNDWHITWLVWPIAGLISAAISIIFFKTEN